MTTTIKPEPESREQQEAALRRREKLRALRDNYAYWARSLYHIKDKLGEIHTLQLNPIQRRMGEIEQAELAKHGRCRIFSLKARQGGISTDQQARNLHLIWSERGATALTLADNRDTTDKIFSITQRAIDNFPDEALPAMGQRQTREISFTLRDSRFYTGTAGAHRTGRGITLKRVHGSEFAFWDEPRRVLNTITPALVPDRSVIVLETTASGYDSEPHHFWQEAVKGENSYRAVFFPWWECDPVSYRLPLEAKDELGTLEPEEKELVKIHHLSLEQIKWRRLIIGDMGKTDFLNEYAEDAESCWIAAGGTFYDLEQLKILLARAPVPIDVTQYDGNLAIYRKSVGQEDAIIGCDTAEGGGVDRSSWTARSFPTWKLLASFADKRIEPDALADMLNQFGRLYGTAKDPALLIVEKNAHGITVLRRLRDHHKYPLHRIYHRVSLDKASGGRSEQLGWATTETSKPLMLDAGRQLFTAAVKGEVDPPSQAAIRDGFAVRRDDRGIVRLNGRDVLVGEMLAWLGRDQIRKTPAADEFTTVRH